MDKKGIANNLSYWKTLILPFSLCFLLSVCAVLNSTYSDALFLSTYPRRWLSYYFFALPIATILVILFAGFFIAKANERQSALYVLGMVIILIICYLLMLSGVYIAAFMLALLLLIFTQLSMIIGINAVAAAFDIRAYKAHAFQFIVFGILGAIFAGFSTPLILHFFQSSAIFYTSLALTACSALFIVKIKKMPAPPEQKTEQINTNLFKKSFFKVLFLLSLLSGFIGTLVNFSFKNALMGVYTQEGLATFISIFMGITCVISLLMQLILAKKLMLWLGLAGILLILPIACIFLGIGIAIFPIFSLFILLNAIYIIFLINFITPCMQMIINPYPTMLRNKINLYLKGYGSAVAGLLGAFFIFLINTYLNMAFFGILIAILSTFWVFITYTATQDYRGALHTALKKHRYGPALLNLSPEAIVFMHQDIIQALQSSDLNILRAGLSFFEDEQLVKYLPDGMDLAIEPLLSHSEKDIRYKAVIALKQLKATDNKHALLSRLNFEEDTSVGFELISSLIHLGVLPLDEQSEAYLTSYQPFKIAYAIVAFDRSNQPGSTQKSSDQLDKLLQGSSTDKLTVAMTEKYLSTTPEQNRRLELLIQDESNEVVIQAILAIKPDANKQFVPILLSLLNSKEKSFFSEIKLAQYQESILDSLLQLDSNTAEYQQLGMIRLLARLNQSTLAMKHLVLLSKSDMILRRFYISRQLVRFFNQNKIRLPIQTLIIEMVTWCSKEISKLLKLDTGNNENVKREIYLQLYINRRVYTAWFSLLADIQDVAPYIEKPDNYPPTEVAKAYELLDALSTDVKLRRSINLISQNCLPMQTINDKTDINPGILLLARHPFQPEKGIVMNTMDKTVFLRRVKLFEDLPVESLLSIAEIATETDMAKGQIIFKENSVSDRLYFIVSGEITLKKYNFVLTELKEADYFGELGLLDNLPRTADAIAETDGVLLYIEKEEFVNILEDMPVIMRAVTAQIIKYLRQVLEYERKNFVPDR